MEKTVSKKGPDAELLLTDTEEIKQELDRLEAEDASLSKELKDLLKKESFAEGLFFAKEIHLLKQKRMDLKFQITFYSSRLKRISSEDY